MLRFTADIMSDVELVSIQAPIPGAFISGSVAFTQPLPTLSMGYLLSGKLFFFNISMGLSIFTGATSSISITGKLPDAIGAAEAAQAFDAVKAQVEEGLVTAAGQMTKELFMLPSLNLSFGFYL